MQETLPLIPLPKNKYMCAFDISSGSTVFVLSIASHLKADSLK